MKNSKSTSVIKKACAKLSVFTFFRLIAYVAGMATGPGALVALAAIFVLILLGMGVSEAIEVAKSGPGVSVA